MQKAVSSCSFPYLLTQKKAPKMEPFKYYLSPLLWRGLGEAYTEKLSPQPQVRVALGL